MSLHLSANLRQEEAVEQGSLLLGIPSRPAAGSATSPDALLPSVFAHDDFTHDYVEGHDGEQVQPLIASGPRTDEGMLSNIYKTKTQASQPIQDSQAPQKFNPLFIVIDDPTTGEQHHPYVHYIFSDDEDTELITNAILHNLNPPLLAEEDESDAQAKGSQQDKERVLILDLDHYGRNVISARSLASDWQIVDTKISVAPTAPTVNNDPKPEDASLMLRIVGIESNPAKKLSPEELFDQAESRAQQDQLKALNDLAEQFQREMGIVQRILDDTTKSSSVEHPSSAI